MADSDRTIWNRLVGAIMGSTVLSNATNTADMVDQRVIQFALPATAANTNVAASGVYYTDRKIKVLEVRLCPAGNVTRDTTNYGLVNIAFNDAANGTETLLAACNTHNSAQGNLVLDNWKNLALDNTANAIVDAGKAIRISLTAVSGNLVAMPRLNVVIRAQEI